MKMKKDFFKDGQLIAPVEIGSITVSIRWHNFKPIQTQDDVYRHWRYFRGSPEANPFDQDWRGVGVDIIAPPPAEKLARDRAEAEKQGRRFSCDPELKYGLQHCTASLIEGPDAPFLQIREYFWDAETQATYIHCYRNWNPKSHVLNCTLDARAPWIPGASMGVTIKKKSDLEHWRDVETAVRSVLSDFFTPTPE